MTAEENIFTLSLFFYCNSMDHRMATSQLRQLDSDMVHLHVCIQYVHEPQGIAHFELALVRTFYLPSDGTDYRSARITVTFSSAMLVIPFTVTINDDFILEFSEYFFLDLEISTVPPTCTVTKASPERSIVHIEDDGETCHVCNCLSGNVLIKLKV